MKHLDHQVWISDLSNVFKDGVLRRSPAPSRTGETPMSLCLQVRTPGIVLQTPYHVPGKIYTWYLVAGTTLSDNVKTFDRKYKNITSMPGIRCRWNLSMISPSNSRLVG